MKKVFCVAACLVFLGAQFVMAGGGGQQSSGSAGTGAAGAQPTTIRIWSNDAHNKLERTQHVDAFNRGEGAERGIVAEYVVYGGDYWPMLDIALSAGEEPHIYKDNKWPQHVAEKRILPLTDFPEWYHREVIDRYRGDMIEGTHTFDGVIYTLPWGGTAYCSMAYNVPLLNSIGLTEPPKTWAEFEKACIDISRANPGKYGTFMPLKYPNYHTNYIEPVLIRSYGYTWFDFTAGRYCFSDFAEYLEMYQRLAQAGAIFPGMEGLDDDTARAQFSEGNVAFVLENPSYNVGVFYDQFPAKMEWKVAPIIVKDLNNQYNPVSGSGQSFAVGIRSKNENVMEQVARVHKLLYSDEMLASLYTGGKDIPRLGEIIQNAKPSDRPQWNDIAKLHISSVPKPTLPDTYYSVEGDDVRTAFSKILTGGNAKEILADLDKRFNEAFDRAISRGIVTREYFIRPDFQENLKLK